MDVQYKWVRREEIDCPWFLEDRKENQHLGPNQYRLPINSLDAGENLTKWISLPTLTEKTELDAAYRISHAEMRSTPRPMTWPCTAAITGNGARSGAATACWRASIVFRICKEALALSRELSVLSPPPNSTFASSTVGEPQKWILNPYEWFLKDAAATYNPTQQ